MSTDPELVEDGQLLALFIDPDIAAPDEAEQGRGHGHEDDDDFDNDEI